MNGSLESAAVKEPRVRRDPIALALLLAALGLRLYPAVCGPLLHDEEHTYIRFAREISFRPGSLHLPIRESQHPALPCYIALAGTLLAGPIPIGYRLGSLLLGMATVVLVYRTAGVWNGQATARWAAFLLAVNEYHVAASSMALELGPQIFFVAVAVHAAVRFSKDERPGWLYLGAAACGLGFLCREVICLLLPVWFIVALLFPERRRWLARREPWLAALLFLLVISPDLYCATAARAGKTQLYADYADHFSRIAGLGFNQYPTLFYLRDLLRPAGIRFDADFNDMQTMNLLAGAVLLVGGAVTAWRRRREFAGAFLGFAFWGVYGFFSLMLLGDPRRDDVNLDNRVFHTVDVTLVPGVLLAGAMLARLEGRRPRRAALVCAGLMAVYVAFRTFVPWPPG